MERRVPPILLSWRLDSQWAILAKSVCPCGEALWIKACAKYILLTLKKHERSRAGKEKQTPRRKKEKNSEKKPAETDCRQAEGMMEGNQIHSSQLKHEAF